MKPHFRVLTERTLLKLIMLASMFELTCHVDTSYYMWFNLTEMKTIYFITLTCINFSAWNNLQATNSSFQHTDKISALLLSKTGENAAKFLMADAEDALLKMAEYVSPPRAVCGLMTGVG